MSNLLQQAPKAAASTQQVAQSCSAAFEQFERTWSRLSDSPATPPGADRAKNQIRVMHWNVLADKLAYGDLKKDGFGCEAAGKKHLLDWEATRQPMIVSEVLRHDPDVISMVELDHFPEMLEALASHGYKGIWLKKNRDFYADGTGLFYKTNRFKEAKKVQQPFLKNGKEPEGKPADQIFCGISLENVRKEDDFSPFLFAGFHLKSTKKEKGEQLRLDQAEQIIAIAEKEFPGMLRILCADLNGESLEQQTRDYTPQAHPYLLKQNHTSAYKDIQGNEPSYTSWKKRVSPEKQDEDGNPLPRKEETFKYTIDFIFKSLEIKTTAVLDLPSEDQFKDIEDILLPCHKCPSDHLMLVADLQLPSEIVKTVQ